MVSRDLCPSRPDTGGTYGYPYYFHRGEVLTSRPNLVEKQLLLSWLVYREYPPGAGRSPIHSTFHSFWCVWVSVSCILLWCNRRRARGRFSVNVACAFGAIPRLRGPPHSPRVYLFGIKEFKVLRCFRSTPRPHALKGRRATVVARAPGRPINREKPVYRAPLAAILTATAVLLAESLRLLPLEGLGPAMAEF